MVNILINIFLFINTCYIQLKIVLLLDILSIKIYLIVSCISYSIIKKNSRVFNFLIILISDKSAFRNSRKKTY